MDVKHDRKRQHFTLLFRVGVIMLGCAYTRDDTPLRQPPFLQTLHPNGLVLRLPHTLIAREAPDGFLVEPRDRQNQQQRFPLEVSIRFHPQASSPSGSWPYTKRLGRRYVHYRVDKNVRGSGGEMYTLHAWEECTNGYLSYQQLDHSEIFTPQFDLAWDIIAGTSLRDVAPEGCAL